MPLDRVSRQIKLAAICTGIERGLNKTRMRCPQLAFRIWRSRLFWNPASTQKKFIWPMVLWPKDLPKKGWINHEIA